MAYTTEIRGSDWQKSTALPKYTVLSKYPK
jgi:hypothetical protein